MSEPQPDDGRSGEGASPGAEVRPRYELVVTALLLGVGMWLLTHSFAARYSEGFAASAPNAMVLPRVLLGLWIGLALVVLVVEWCRRRSPRHDDLRAVLLLCTLFVVAAVALPYVGFLIMITPLIAGVLLTLGERRPVPLLGATLLLGPASWFVFHHVLLIRLPSIVPGGMF